MVELHDAAAPAELITYEELGLCGEGEGPALLSSGATALGGKIPVNLSGGLLSKGHPIGATGCGQLVELADQLRGRCGQRQVGGGPGGAGPERWRFPRHRRGGDGRHGAVHVVTVLEPLSKDALATTWAVSVEAGFLSVKRREAVNGWLDEFTGEQGWTGKQAVVNANVVRSFLIHNGVLIQGRVWRG